MESSLTSPHRYVKSCTLKSKKQSLLTCVTCGYAMNLKKQLRRHMFKHIRGKLPPLKRRSSRAHFTYTSHFQLTPDLGKKYLCILCNSKYKYMTGLKRHLEKHQDCPNVTNGIKELPPKKIRQGFSRVKFMMESGQKFESDKPFRCEVCGQGFMTKNKLKRHIHIHDSNLKYSCKLCNYSTSRNDTLTNHERTHTQLRNHTCLKCYKRFKTVKCLKSHVITHAGIRKLECPICSGILNSLAKFKTHINRHKNDTPPEELALPLLMMRDKLNELYQRFIADCPGLSALNMRGRRSPRRSRPYLPSTFLCNVCGYITKRKDNFLVHLLVHGQERPYKCEHCMYSCKSPSNLCKHIKLYHHTNSASIRRYTRIPRKYLLNITSSDLPNSYTGMS